MEQPDGSGPENQHQNGRGIHAIASRAEERMRGLGETARSQAEERVHRYGGMAQQRIDVERARVAARIEEAATRLRERGTAAGSVGQNAGEQVATRMEAAAGYLYEHDTDQIAGDVATFVRNHPVKSIVAAAVMGYLVGRLAA